METQLMMSYTLGDPPEKTVPLFPILRYSTIDSVSFGRFWRSMNIEMVEIIGPGI